MITAYVKAGDLRVPETALFHYLRMFQEQYGIRHLRVDPGDSSSVRAAVRWARSQDIPVSHQGIPSLVIVPDQPCSYTPGTEINDKAVSTEVKRISAQAYRTSGADWPKRLLIPLLPPATVVWLTPDPPAPPY